MLKNRLYVPAAVLVLLAGSAFAVPTVHLTRLAGQYSGNGGEFTLTPNAELTALTDETGPFSSFCLEKNEFVSLGSVYDVMVATEAFRGGNNDGPVGPRGGDLLDPMTAYLYTAFRHATLTGYDYTPGAGRSASAGALQDVIWYIEDEAGKTWHDGDGSLQDRFYTAAVSAGWTDIGNARVLNLYSRGHLGDNDYLAQDQLVLIPAPGAVVLGGIGTMLAGWLRRRRLL